MLDWVRENIPMSICGDSAYVCLLVQEFNDDYAGLRHYLLVAIVHKRHEDRDELMQLTDTISAVIRKSIATSTLAVVRANCVVADAVTATIVCRTLVHVCACTTFTNEL